MGAVSEVHPPRHWSTDTVDPRRALAYWVDTICDQFLELEIDTPVRERFQARLDQVELGPASANFIQAGVQSINRTRAKIARTRSPVFFLLQLRLGQVRFRHMGQDLCVKPGECVFIDSTEPYEFECPQPTSALALRMPADWLSSWVPSAERHAARLFNAGGWSSALCAALDCLDPDSCDQLALPKDAIADPIAALLKLAIGPDAQRSSERPVLFNQLMHTLRGRFHEPDLSLQAVADEHRISTRCLHYAFAGAKTTFIDQLVRLRLERARQILGDVQLSDMPIAEVAARCGFTDPSHFARRFRRRFSQAPLQFRNSATRCEH
jgi:AraC family transcriptional regulator, positive regulator of tynA and feaB